MDGKTLLSKPQETYLNNLYQKTDKSGADICTNSMKENMNISKSPLEESFSMQESQLEANNIIDNSSKEMDAAVINKNKTSLNQDSSSRLGLKMQPRELKELRSLKMMEKLVSNTKQSRDMTNVMNALGIVENLVQRKFDLNAKGKAARFKKYLSTVEGSYTYAIDKCSIYLANKDSSFWYYDKTRYKAVKNSREMLEKELGYLSEIQHKMENGEPVVHGQGEVNVLDLMYDMQDEEKNKVKELQLEDFIKVSSDITCESVICRNGKLYKLNDTDLRMENQSSSTKENYQMVESLINRLLERQNISSEEARSKISINLRLWLGTDMENEKAGPVSLEKIREIFHNMKTKVFDMDTVLENEKADEEERLVAQQIDKLLGRFFGTDGADNAKSQLDSIMNAGERSKEWKPSWNSVYQSFDSLVYGNIDLVRNRAFHSALRIMKNRKRLNPNAKETSLLNEEMKQLLGLALSEITASDDSYSKVHAMRIRCFETTMSIKGQDRLINDLKAVQIGEFHCFSAEMVRDVILNSRNLQLNQMNSYTKRDIIHWLTEITENMQEITSIVNKGLNQGISEPDAETLRKKSNIINQSFGEIKGFLNVIEQVFGVNSTVPVALRKLGKIYNPGNEDGIENRQKLSGCIEDIIEKLKIDEKVILDEKPEKVEESQDAIPEYFAAKNIVETFNGRARKIAQIFLGERRPSDLIGKPGSRMEGELRQLYVTLCELINGEAERIKININGVSIWLCQNDGILFMESGGERVALPSNAKYWVKEMEEDVFAHFDKYETSNARTMMRDAIVRDEMSGNLSRTKYETFLTRYVGITSAELNNLSFATIQSSISDFCNNNKKTKESLNKKLSNCAIKAVTQQVLVNSQSSLECLTAMDKMEKKLKEDRLVKKDIPKKAIEYAGEEKDWSSDQKKMLNFIGGIFFSEKAATGNSEYTVERLKKAMIEHSDGLVEMLRLSDGDCMNFLGRFVLFESFQTTIGNLYSLIAAMKKKITEVENKEISEDRVIELVKNGALDNVLKENAKNIENSVNAISVEMQGLFKEAVENLDEPTDDQWKGIKELTIEELLQKETTGKEGEGAFNKEVLSGYIDNDYTKDADRQKMVASAFKNVSYIESCDIGEMSETDREKLAGKFIASYIKGAGPLLHKTLQGIPISTMPLAMQEAVKSVRSDLTKIDDAFVDAQLHRIICESDNSIEKIEKLQVLGAASVGETILIKVYENGARQGVEKVVKLLRPDVQNRMEREIQFMEKCAQKVDFQAYSEKNGKKNPPENYVGGMQKTYRNKITGIRKEMDLRLEAENIEAGKIYEDESLHIRSMSMDAKAKKKTDVLILEKAPGVSVDKFLVNKDRERKHIVESRTRKEKPESAYKAVNELNTLRDELKKKQKYLFDLTYKWLEEAIFGSGFFHGDLHSGNIMMDDHGVTIIDYGNAQRFEPGDKNNIANLICAASSMNTSQFKNFLRALLPPEAQDLYDSKRATLDEDIRDILKKEDGDSLQKIFVVLAELQREGIEVPAKLNSFIQSMIRLYGTLTDYEKLIDKVNDDITGVMEGEDNRSIEESPEAPVMPEIMKNILYLHDAKYKEYRKNGNLSSYVEEAFNEAKVNITSLTKVFGTATNCSQRFIKDPELEFARKKIEGIDIALIGDVCMGRALFAFYYVLYDSNCVRDRLKECMCDVSQRTYGMVLSLKDHIDRNHYNVKQELVDNLENTQKELEENAKAPDYTRENAVSDINKFLNAFRQILGEWKNDPVEKKFLKDAFDYRFAAFPLIDESNWQLEVNLKQDWNLDTLELSEPDKTEQKKKEEEAKKRLQESAQALYMMDQNRIKSYKQKLAETILAEDKFKQMGMGLKEWYGEDQEKQLRIAYDAVEQARKENLKLTTESVQVKRLMETILNCVTARAKKLEKIVINKNIEDHSADVVASKLFRNHWMKSLWYVNWRLPLYIKDHKLNAVDKERLVTGYKNNHSDYVKDLAASIRKNNVKGEMIKLEKAKTAYSNTLKKSNPKATEEELKESVENYNNAINQFMQTLANLVFSLPGQKRFASLLEGYEQDPSVRTLQHLLTETHKYIKEQLENTIYMDPTKNENGEEEKSLYDKYYSNVYGNREFLVADKQLSFVCDYGDVIRRDGKPKKLLERLKKHENLKWIERIS